MATMQENLLDDRYKDMSFQIIGISFDDMIEYLAQFRQRVGSAVKGGNGLTFPWLACNSWIHIDHYKEVQAQWAQTTTYKLLQYQILVLVNRDGIIRWLQWGGDAVSNKINYFDAFDTVGTLLEEAQAQLP